MHKYHIPYWKDAPFIRVIIPFICGIAISYYLALPEKHCFIFSAAFFYDISCLFFLKAYIKIPLQACHWNFSKSLYCFCRRIHRRDKKSF